MVDSCLSPKFSIDWVDDLRECAFCERRLTHTPYLSYSQAEVKKEAQEKAGEGKSIVK